MGYLLARQLVAAGQRVLDVQPEPGARVRLPDAGDTNTNDPDDARSVAVAALRPPGAKVRADDHATVLKVWSKRHRDLGRARTQLACRLHTVLSELLPGGVSKHITAGQVTRILGSFTPPDAVAASLRAMRSAS
jgi:transposase